MYPLSRSCSFRFLITSILCALAFTSPALAQLPDVRPEIQNISINSDQIVDFGDVAEGCAGDVFGRTLLRFDAITWNDGPSNLVLGDPACPDCFENPGATCGNSIYMCSGADGHNHPHLRDFADYTVRRAGSPDIIRRGHKEGFCFFDTYCYGDATPNPENDCTTLTAGCGDLYASGLGCQYVDITGLEPGDYTLRVALNSDLIFQELSYLNNAVESSFRVCAPSTGFNLSLGPIDPKIEGSKPFKLSAKIRLTPGVTIDPMTQTVHLALTLDGFTVFNVNIPPGGKLSGCGPRDGWRRAGKRHWKYLNQTGSLSQYCDDSSQGIRKVEIELLKRGTIAEVKIEGRVPLVVAPRPPQTGTFRLSDFSGVVNDTCQATKLTKCRFTGGKNIVTKCR